MSPALTWSATGLGAAEPMRSGLRFAVVEAEGPGAGAADEEEDQHQDAERADGDAEFGPVGGAEGVPGHPDEQDVSRV